MKAIPYIIAFLIGLFARTMISAMNGWEGYVMDGHDIVLAVDCVIMLWAAKGVFTLKMPQKSNGKEKLR